MFYSVHWRRRIRRREILPVKFDMADTRQKFDSIFGRCTTSQHGNELNEIIFTAEGVLKENLEVFIISNWCFCFRVFPIHFVFRFSSHYTGSLTKFCSLFSSYKVGFIKLGNNLNVLRLDNILLFLLGSISNDWFLIHES